jgi:cold shock CspA family protein
MTVDKLQGIISMYLPDRGFGFLIVGQGKDIKKYFFHITRVVSGVPAIGAIATFSVHPIQEGKLPSAVDVEVQS